MPANDVVGSSADRSSSSSSSSICDEHVYICFETLHELLLPEHDFQPLDRASLALPDEDASFPLFVTWNLFSSVAAAERASCAGEDEGQAGDSASSSTSSSRPQTARLRGCIGTFEPMPVRRGLEEYAEVAALHDTRFDPIAIRELDRLECG